MNPLHSDQYSRLDWLQHNVGMDLKIFHRIVKSHLKDLDPAILWRVSPSTLGSEGCLQSLGFLF